MNMRTLILAFLSAAPAAGCCIDSVCDCEIEDKVFDVDAELTAADVTELLDARREAVSDIDCHSACDQMFGTQPAMRAETYQTCSHTIDEQAYLDAVGDTGSGWDTDVVGSVQCTGTGPEGICLGRRPMGHAEWTRRADDLGACLAQMAHLEAAAVQAFEQLAQQLIGFGAPAGLVERCRMAAAEERVHARLLGQLARRHGASVPPVGQPVVAPLALVDVALHNAIEGCVHETWAAVEAELQAREAASPALRATFARVARDEARHAQLAWDLHAWFLAVLDAEQAREVRAAQAQAMAVLPQRVSTSARLRPAALGLPEPGHAQRLAQAFMARLAA